MMRPLPGEFNLLKIASHVAVISQEKVTATIFLVDLKRVLNHLEQRVSDYPVKIELLN